MSTSPIDPRTFAESGILLVDKPVGWTSHDIVNCVRQRFRIKKVGHCGTLDPNATGLLVLMLGQATRLSDKLMGQDKVYEGIIRLGVTTSTQDAEGEVTETREVDPVLTLAAIRAAVAGFVGDIEQIPPMVSAVKKDGKRLYKLARQGLDVERDARPVTVREFRIDKAELPDLAFHIECSKGTYVRTLADDLGRNLGCGGHLLTLRRLASGKFSVGNAFTMEQIKSWEREDLFARMIPLHQIVGYV